MVSNEEIIHRKLREGVGSRPGLKSKSPFSFSFSFKLFS